MISKRVQSGYLLEVPLTMFAAGMLLALLLPLLPEMWGKVLFVAVALVMIWGSYYMIVIPGWQPGNPTRLRWPWNMVLFLFVALLIVVVTAGWVAM